MRTFSAVTMCMLLTGAVTLAAAQPVPPPRTSAPPPSRAAEAITVSGVVTDYTTTPGGDLDGVVLGSGEVVHFPARAGARVRPLIRRGSRVIVRGRLRSESGRRVLEAQTISNGASGELVAVGSPPTLEDLRK
jgi:hypothetical protein